jgi:1-deoxy-D-xylulose-5-phosphate reductoisomerase
VIHPESIVHSLVEYVDGSMIAQLGVPDMRLPIQYALTYPDRSPSRVGSLELDRLGKLTFEPPDLRRFRCLDLAYGAVRQGGTAPAVLSAANEVAVEAFLAERLPFSRIPTVAEEVLQAHRSVSHPSAEEISEADGWARQEASRILGDYG